jgi:hypothetical protein
MKSPDGVQWFICSQAIKVRCLSIAICVNSGSCTAWGHPHRTCPSRRNSKSGNVGLGSSTMSAPAMTSSRVTTAATIPARWASDTPNRSP